MLSSSKVEANIPAADIRRAREFYADKLGLLPDFEVEGLLHYTTEGGTPFSVYQTEYAGQAGHTIAQWHVDDLDGEIHDLQAKGVTFETYDDMPGVEWDGVVAKVAGMWRGAWFKDSEGNVMCLDEPPQIP